LSVALDPPLGAASSRYRSPTVAALRASFEAGYTRGLDWRRQQLLALRLMLHDHRDALASALRADVGKPEIESLQGELAEIALEASFALKHLAKWMRPERVGPLTLPGRRKVMWDPLGIVLILSPWNYPVGLLLAPLVGAIAAGNCAVLRPAESAVRTSALLAELVPRYLDPGAIALVPGGASATKGLLEERFDYIFYAGGGRLGRSVMRAAARHLTPVTVELLGKSPCIVDAQVDIREAARRIAAGKFQYAGQTCAAPDYVLVVERRERALLDELRRAIGELHGGDPRRSAHYARIGDPARYARLEAMLADGEVVIGGQTDADEGYIAPTVLRRVAPDARIMSEEVLGPILPVFGVRSITDAIDFVNGRDDPLALYVFSDDEDVQHTVLEQTRSGRACVNGIPHVADRALPVGDIGAHHGHRAFEIFSERISVLNRGKRYESQALYPAYMRLKAKLVSRKL
jgi:aldehyde dehydrogenase (NAD+)